MNTIDLIGEALEAYGATEVSSQVTSEGVEEINFKYKDKDYYLGSEDTTAGAYSTAFTYTGQYGEPE